MVDKISFLVFSSSGAVGLRGLMGSSQGTSVVVGGCTGEEDHISNCSSWRRRTYCGLLKAAGVVCQGIV